MSGSIADNVGRGSGVIAAAGGGGKVLQCVQTVVDGQPTTTSTSFVDISGLTVTTAALASSSSKVLVMIHMVVGATSGYTRQAKLIVTPSGGSAADLYKGTGKADSGSAWNVSLFPTWQIRNNNTNTETAIYLDDTVASTVARTYKITWHVESGGTLYLNRTQDGTYGHGVSSILAMEIGA